MPEWKAIPDYEGFYEVSDTGLVKSIARTVVGKTGQKYFVTESYVRQRYKKRKDRLDAVVNLSKNGHKKTFLVARLVAIAWCENYRRGLTVNHIDGDTLNNKAENLEWVTREENVRRGHKSGLYGNRYRPCSLINSKGEIQHFPSTSEASRFLGRSIAYVSSRIYLGRDTAYSIDGEEYGLV